jgi:putative spermidine/putrescine transport system substrate-binding protein
MKRHPLDRRRFCLTLAALAARPARAAETLRVLAWPGYADPDVVEVFARRHRVQVDVTTIDTDEALWQKVGRNQGRDFDVFAVNTAELQRYIRRGLVSSLDVAAVPNRAAQLPRFQDLGAIPGLVHGGRVFAIPYTYAAMGLIYDRGQIREAPDSIAALWDPAYRGKVIAYDGGVHAFSLAAQSLGLKSPFRLEPQDWPRVVERLIALRRNVAAFYTQPDESVSLFRRRNAALLFANYGTQQLKAVKAAGIDAGYVTPKEGALAWLDCWTVTSGARNPALAAAWIDYLLEGEPGRILTQRQGLANTTSVPAGHPQTSDLVWLEPVESEERRNLLWSRIMAGDRAARVLSP